MGSSGVPPAYAGYKSVFIQGSGMVWTNSRELSFVSVDDSQTVVPLLFGAAYHYDRVFTYSLPAGWLYVVSNADIQVTTIGGEFSGDFRFARLDDGRSDLVTGISTQGAYIASATNTAVDLTIAAPSATQKYILTSFAYRPTGAPGAGATVTLKEDAITIFADDVVVGGQVFDFANPIELQPGKAPHVILPALGAGVACKVRILGRWVQQ